MDFPPSTIGMIPASQASLRRAWSAVIRSPVSNTAGVSLSPSRFSRVIVTTTVASTPPAWGSRSTG